MPADQETATQAAAPAPAPPAEAPKETPAGASTEAPKEAPSTPAESSEAPAPPPKDTEPPAAAPAAAALETPLTKLSARLPEIIKSTAHSEMWGVQLGDPDSHVPTKVVLQKFLRANNGDAAGAEKQLTAALEWRKKMNPPALVGDSYEEAKFGGLGYVTVHKDEAGKETVVTWNIYGAVKSFKTTFGDLDG